MIQQLNDTIACNPELLARYQNDENFNYNRELELPDLDLWQWFINKLRELVGEILDFGSPGNIKALLYIAGALVLIGLLIFFLAKHRPRLFGRKGRAEVDKVEANDIYGINFDDELRRAMQKADYTRAVCVIYLKTLRRLADEKLIVWKIYKTPTQYTREFLHPDFGRFTTLFMRVRYGNRTATTADVQQMQAMQQNIEKGGEQ